jgi:hypothetical protein
MSELYEDERDEAREDFPERDRTDGDDEPEVEEILVSDNGD